MFAPPFAAFAKDQITHLTDEIALKFEDNVAQQEEITQLISTVVELQRKQKQVRKDLYRTSLIMQRDYFRLQQKYSSINCRMLCSW